MLNRIITTNIRKLSHSHRPTNFNKLNEERINELEKIIESQNNTIKYFEEKSRNKYSNKFWGIILVGTAGIFVLKIFNEIIDNMFALKIIDKIHKKN